MTKSRIDQYLGSRTGLSERRVYLERYLLEKVFPGLPASDRMQAVSAALNKRIALVKALKRKEGGTAWTWRPGEPIPDNDQAAQAYLGDGTSHLFLAEVLCAQLYGIPLTDRNVPILELRLGVDTCAPVRARVQQTSLRNLTSIRADTP